MVKRTAVIINKQHSLFEEQKEILDERFPNWEFFFVPENGWNLEEMEMIEMELQKFQTIIFASPIPILIKRSTISALCVGMPETILVFHNDKREKKELPGGKIIQAVSSTGWKLV